MVALLTGVPSTNHACPPVFLILHAAIRTEPMQQALAEGNDTGKGGSHSFCQTRKSFWHSYLTIFRALHSFAQPKIPDCLFLEEKEPPCRESSSAPLLPTCRCRRCSRSDLPTSEIEGLAPFQRPSMTSSRSAGQASSTWAPLTPAPPPPELEMRCSTR
jgi:hypothetical protein